MNSARRETSKGSSKSAGVFSRSVRVLPDMKHYFLAAIILGLGGPMAFAQWQIQTIPTKSDFRGLCVVSPTVAWVSGTAGTYARTTDGGKMWSVGTVAGAEK